MGENNYLNKCKISGVNGLIVVDLPWPENKVLQKNAKENQFILYNYYHLQQQK